MNFVSFSPHASVDNPDTQLHSPRHRRIDLDSKPGVHLFSASRARLVRLACADRIATGVEIFLVLSVLATHSPISAVILVPCAAFICAGTSFEPGFSGVLSPEPDLGRTIEVG
jgi:hypothetical protein